MAEEIVNHGHGSARDLSAEAAVRHDFPLLGRVSVRLNLDATLLGEESTDIQALAYERRRELAEITEETVGIHHRTLHAGHNSYDIVSKGMRIDENTGGWSGAAGDGRTWRDLHNRLTGKQTPGMAGASPGYLKSRKFLKRPWRMERRGLGESGHR